MSTANAGFIGFVARFSGKSASLGVGNIPAALRPWVLSAVVSGLATFGCGTPAANLVISAPSNVIAGSPFTVTVTAMAGGSRDRIINSAIHFTSSDRAAVLALDYQFAATDAGSHTFVKAFTLRTPGSQSITATVTTSSVINGTALVTVTAATPAMQSSIAP